MADWYKGLVIRIGADEMPLRKALQAANTAIFKTQKELRTLQEAARIDPNNINVITRQVDLMGDEYNAVRQKVRLLNVEMEHLREEAANSGMSVGKYLENAELKARNLGERYKFIDDQISATRNEMLTMVVATDEQRKALEAVKNDEKARRDLNAQIANEYKDQRVAVQKIALARNVATDKEKKALDKLIGDDEKRLALAEKILGKHEKQAKELLKEQGGWVTIKSLVNEVAKAQSQLDNVEFQNLRELETTLSKQHNEILQSYEAAKRLAEVGREVYTKWAAATAELRQIYQSMKMLGKVGTVKMLSAEFMRLEDKLEVVDDTVKKLRADGERLEEALRLDPSNVRAASMLMENYQNRIKEATDKAKILNEEIKQLENSGTSKLASRYKNVEGVINRLADRIRQLKMQQATLEENSEEFKKLEHKIDAATAALLKLGNVKVLKEKKAEAAALSSEVTALTAKMKSAGIATRNFGANMQQFGWASYATITPLFSMFAYSAINAAETIDAAYRDMRKTVEGTEEQFEDLRDRAVDFSRTHITTADQILEIQAMGGQLGIAVDSLGSFAEVVSNLDIATNLEADTIAEQLGQLTGILGVAAEDTDEFFVSYGDALTRLGNNAPTLESNIENVMLRISSMGSIVGFQADELLAWATAVAATGQGSEAAGTAISKTMADIESAVGAGGEKLEAFASVANMSSEEFAKAWDESPSVAMKAFIDGLNAIEADGGSAANTLKGLGINSVRQKQAILGLMQTVGDLDDYLLMSGDAWDGVSDKWGKAGDAAREASKKSEGFSGQIKMIRNNLTALAMEIGESMAPVLQAANGLLQDFTAWFDSLDNKSKMAVDELILVIAAIGPLTISLNAISRAGKAFSSWLDTAVDAWKAVNSATKRGNKILLDSYYAAEKAGTGVGGFTKSTIESVKQTSKFQKAMKLLRVSLAGVAAIAAVYVAYALWEKFKKDKKHAEDLAKATEGMEKAATGFGEAVSKEGDALDDAARAAKNAKFDFEDFLETQASLVDEMNDTNKSAAVEVAQLSRARQTLGKYLNTSIDTVEEQQEFAAAVEVCNDILGTNWEVVDLANGKIRAQGEEADLTKDKLYELIDAQILEAKTEAARSNYMTAQEAQTNAAEAYAAALDEQAAAQDNYNAKVEDLKKVYGSGFDPTDTNWLESIATWDLVALTKLNSDLQTANNNLSDSKEALESATNSADSYASQLGVLASAEEGAADSMELAVAGNMEMIGAMKGGTEEISMFAQALEDSGISMEELSNLAPGQATRLVKAYEDGNKDLRGVLDSMNKEVESSLSVDASGPARKTTNAYSRGIAGGAKSARDAAYSLAASVSGPLSALAGQATIWGYHLGDNLAGSIQSKASAAHQAALALANSISGPLHQSVADVGPLKYTDEWGVDLVQNIIDGMKSKEKALRGEVRNVSNILGEVGYDTSLPSSYANAQAANSYNNSRSYVIQINGATINDNAAMRDATKSFLVEMMRTANI